MSALTIKSYEHVFHGSGSLIGWFGGALLGLMLAIGTPLSAPSAWASSAPVHSDQLIEAEGDALWEAGAPDRAIERYQTALKNPSLSASAKARLHRKLGYTLVETGDPLSGAEAFDTSLQYEPNADAQLGQAVALRLAGKKERAAQALASVDLATLPPASLEKYHAEQAALQEQGDLAQGKAGNIDLAYQALAAGDDTAAISHFQKAEAAGALTAQSRADYGYALKRTGQEKAAAEAFRGAIDELTALKPASASEDAERLWRLRREVSYIDRQFYADAFLVYRGNSTNALNLPESDGESFAGSEIGWLAPSLGDMKHRALTLFARGFVGFEEDTLDLRDDSLQLGIGARFRPLAEHNLVFTAERLIKAGDAARDAWLFVAGYSLSEGLDIYPLEDHWESWNIYADVAYIPDDPYYFSSTLESWYGHSYKLSDRFVITPHLIGAARFTDDPFDTDQIVETGVGVGARYWYREDRYRGPQSYVDLAVQYRYALINEEDRDDGALVVRAFFHF